ncbi:MAG: FkbM family methyltransferase [Pseudomonadota bacterium]|nr:FkbM family methyltransferase [Pseudomonadota bacterium]
MITWKRRLADWLASHFGLQVARRGAAWALIEPEQLQRFFTSFKVDCVLDVGANVGQYAERLRHIGYKGLIISFEPNPAAANAMMKTRGGDKLWIVKQMALDSQSRTANFNVMKSIEFSSLHEPDQSRTTAFRDENSVEQKISLQTQTLAQVLPALQAEFGFARPFLKMDTQGHDVAVVQGAGNQIRQFAGLQSELALTPLYQGAPTYLEALEFYRSLGFKLSGLIPNNAGHFPDLNEVDCIMYNPEFL